jgi:hypothetical protein
MGTISGKINLMYLKTAIRNMKGKDGYVECLVIPIEANKLFKGEKGVYLDLIAFEKEKKGDGKDTHLIKQSFSKDDRALMSDEEIKSFPILGNLQVWDGVTESTPTSSMNVGNEDDDLPF